MKSGLIMFLIFIVALILSKESAMFYLFCLNIFSIGSMFYVDTKDISENELFRINEKLISSSLILIMSFMSLFFSSNNSSAFGIFIFISCIPVVYLSIVKEKIINQLKNKNGSTQ